MQGFIIYIYFKQHIGNVLGKGLEAQQHQGKSFSLGIELLVKKNLSIWQGTDRNANRQ